jgi:4-hydroxybenzoate polyprenyltransferase
MATSVCGCKKGVQTFHASGAFVMLRSIHGFLGLIRFSHTLFALPFALTSAALAWNLAWDDLTPLTFTAQLAGILLCMVFARSAAMAFNRLADRKLDADNPRTAGRHLPSGQLSEASVWTFLVVSAAGFVASTLLFVALANPWPFYLAAPVLVFICAYSFTKRFTALCHFWLGASLLLAPVAAWIAVRGMPDWPEVLIPLLLGGGVMFWVAGFDVLYACQDVDFDRKARLHSVPAAIGVAASLRVALMCHAVMLGLLLTLYAVTPQLGWVFLVGLILVAVLLGYEHWLVRPDDLTRVNQAFFQVNAVISVGLFLLVLVQLATGL